MLKYLVAMTAALVVVVGIGLALVVSGKGDKSPTPTQPITLAMHVEPTNVKRSSSITVVSTRCNLTDETITVDTVATYARASDGRSEPLLSAPNSSINPGCLSGEVVLTLLARVDMGTWRIHVDYEQGGSVIASADSDEFTVLP